MSASNSIALLLNIQDKNIIIDPNSVSTVLIHGVSAYAIEAKLSYHPDCCPHCGCMYDAHTIHKHGSKRSCIKLPEVSKRPAYLYLYKQRYLCHHCKQTFFNTTPLVSRNCFISSNTKYAIAKEAKQKTSEVDIASRNNVSHMTINRIINSYYNYYKIKRSFLPEHLCFDEFKSVKSSDASMSFLFMDAVTHKLIDIVEDRRLHKLLEYFRLYPYKVRAKVKTITIDMYSPYISLIKQMFPNASIITDKFHVVQLLSRSLNKTRIKVMNENKQHYHKLKRYWKLLLKNYSDLNDTEFKKYRCFKHLMRECDIVNELIALDTTLKITYDVYQDLLTAIKNRSYKQFSDVLCQDYPQLSSYMKISLTTLKEYAPFIQNAFQYPYTNGGLEGKNNLIKVIKRIAFGYRSFYHFKIRIMIISNDLSSKKKIDKRKTGEIIFSPAA